MGRKCLFGDELRQSWGKNSDQSSVDPRDKGLLTVAQRTERIPRVTYNYDTGILELVDTKIEYFAGFQYAIADPLLLGVFLNYYLVRDVTLGATLFF